MAHSFVETIHTSCFTPYDRSKARHYYWEDQRQFDALRILMRRSFINLQRNERYLNGYDGGKRTGI